MKNGRNLTVCLSYHQLKFFPRIPNNYALNVIVYESIFLEKFDHPNKQCIICPALSPKRKLPVRITTALQYSPELAFP